MFKWVPGRQGGDYFKVELLNSKRLRMHLVLLKLPKGVHIAYHKDPAPDGFKHWRVNFVFWRGATGSRLVQGQSLFARARAAYGGFFANRLNIFRPDEVIHGVSRASETSYALSFGWLQRKK